MQPQRGLNPQVENPWLIGVPVPRGLCLSQVGGGKGWEKDSKMPGKQTNTSKERAGFASLIWETHEQPLKVVLRIRNNGGWEEFDHQERKLQRVKALPFFFSHFLQISLKKNQKRGKKHQKNKKARKARKPQGPRSKAPWETTFPASALPVNGF